MFVREQEEIDQDSESEDSSEASEAWWRRQAEWAAGRRIQRVILRSSKFLFLALTFSKRQNGWSLLQSPPTAALGISSFASCAAERVDTVPPERVEQPQTSRPSSTQGIIAIDAFGVPGAICVLADEAAADMPRIPAVERKKFMEVEDDGKFLDAEEVTG